MKKSVFAQTFYSLLHQMLFSKFLSVVDTKGILSQNQMKITLISNSLEQLSWMTHCLRQFFSRHLLKHLKLRLPGENDLYDTSLCYLVY